MQVPSPPFLDNFRLADDSGVDDDSRSTVTKAGLSKDELKDDRIWPVLRAAYE